MESLQGPRQNGKLREKGILVFFCNLEKKQFTEKIISKLVVENNQDRKAILTEQKLFYEKLYKSSNPRHEELHNELFLNNDNPLFQNLVKQNYVLAKVKLPYRKA